jgi:hypothetical protein
MIPVMASLLDRLHVTPGRWQLPLWVRGFAVTAPTAHR